MVTIIPYRMDRNILFDQCTALDDTVPSHNHNQCEETKAVCTENKSSSTSPINEITGKCKTVATYEPVKYADTVLTIDENNDICYLVHKAILSRQLEHFHNLLITGDCTNTIQLPSSTVWNTTDFIHFLSILYNKYDKQLYQLQYSTNIHSRLFTLNCSYTCTVNGEPTNECKCINLDPLKVKLPDNNIVKIFCNECIFPCV